jgi:hypothetical protein
MVHVFADRYRPEGVAAFLATWIAFSLTLPRQIGTGVVDLAIGAAVAVPLVLVGFAATTRVRPRPPRDAFQQVKFLTVSAGVGVALGTALLLVDMGLIRIDPRVAHIAGRSTRPLDALLRAFEAAPFEEVLFRLVVMGVAAWAITRYLPRSESPYRAALLLSALIFGALHLPDVTFVGLMLVVGNTAAGIVLGWLFWHWGLPSAISCHFAAGLIIQYVGPRIFS